MVELTLERQPHAEAPARVDPDAAGQADRMCGPAVKLGLQEEAADKRSVRQASQARSDRLSPATEVILAEVEIEEGPQRRDSSCRTRVAVRPDRHEIGPQRG